MNKFNTYDLVERYKKARYDMENEAIPVSSSFKTIPGEDKEKVSIDMRNDYYTIIHNIEVGNFSDLDITIVCLVAQFKYVTAKQIYENLILMGFETDESKVTNSINKLHRNQLVYLFRFVSPDGGKTAYRIVTLDKFGYQMAKQLEVPCNWSAFERVDPVDRIKKVLAGNQIRNAYLKSGLNIEWLFSRKTIIDKNSGQVVKPSFFMRMNDKDYCFEVVRKHEFWKQELIDKLDRYIDIFGDNDFDCNVSFNGKPFIIFNGEDNEHNQDIYNLVKEKIADFEFAFTHDLLLFGKNFKHSLYKIYDSNAIEHLELPTEF